jgi:P pilus assembly chaperone PapD
MKRTIKTAWAGGVLALAFAGALQAQASVVIAATRVIYQAKDRETTVKLGNEGQSPALTQAWIDKGDPKASPGAIDVPFAVTPPVARIDPGKAQTLRILHTGEALPQDKESVFWLNVLEVPPKPGAEDSEVNKLQMAFRSRIKLFFRPAGLQGLANDAPAQVTWRRVEAGPRVALEGRNPTPYHVSFASLELVGGGKAARFDDGDMIAPGQTMVFPLTGDAPQGADAKVRYHAVNDHGGATRGETPLAAP